MARACSGRPAMTVPGSDAGASLRGRGVEAVGERSVAAGVNLGTIVTGDNATVIHAWDVAGYRLEMLGPAIRPRRVPRSQRLPSYLLDAQRQVVPYRPRPEDQRLADWRDDAEPVSVLLVHGAGGAGKTRLA